MANTRLEIGTNENVGYFTDIPVNILFQISDIKDPNGRKGSVSRTINLPGSQTNNILFENIFEANIDLQTFNPHLKVEAKYYVNELVMFTGNAKLVKINVNDTTKEVRYEVVLLGEIVTLFTDIANLYLTDLDFSAYDHDLTYAQISGSWGALGNGFVYPIIDWGTNNSNLSVMRPIDFRACYFVREYLDKIFTDAGYTWTSSFLDSTFFQKLIIPPTSPATLVQATLDDAKFLAVANGSQTHSINMLLLSASTNFVQATSLALNDVNFQSETYDAGAIFADPTFTVPVTSTYNVTANLDLNFVVTRNAVDVSANITGNASGIWVIIYNTTTSSIAGVSNFSVSNASFAASNINKATVSLNNVQLNATDAYKIVIEYNSVKVEWTAPTTGATWVFESTVLNTSTFAAELATTNVYEGASVPGDSLVPVGVKQADFISSLIKMFNLYFMIDPANPKNYIIEPREDFYTSSTIDWTDKHDDNSLTEITPLGDLDAKDYRFTYKTDGDFYNKLYADAYKNNDSSPQVYGTHEESITNDFLKSLKVTDTIFSPTPYAINTTSGIVAPAILKKENNIVAETPSNIRILYYGGSISIPGVSWIFSYNNGTANVTYNTILTAGHSDNPYNPTLDINFGLPVKLYYTYPNLYWTTNNLYNTYYKRYIQQISDKNSKVVATDFYLTPVDINQFDFRKVIFWKDAYYIVEKIDFNPLVTAVSRVTLLKLTDYDAFVPVDYLNDSGLGGANASWEMVKGGNTSQGSNNFVESNNSSITSSENCFIANSSDNCQLISCDNCKVIGAENFTAIGASDMVFDSTYSNTVYVGSDASVDITSDTTLSRAYHNKTVYLDATAGDITLTWDCYNMNDVKINFIRTDSSANVIYITDTGTYGTESFIGNGLPYDLNGVGFVQYAALPLVSKTDTIYISN